jgi:hypothetical protein
VSFHSSFGRKEPTEGIDAMPLSPEQEALCERLEKGESNPIAAALIRQQAHEIDDLGDRLSRAYALVRKESPAEMIQEEMEQLRVMLDERRNQPAHSGVLRNARKPQ